LIFKENRKDKQTTKKYEET